MSEIKHLFEGITFIIYGIGIIIGSAISGVIMFGILFGGFFMLFAIPLFMISRKKYRKHLMRSSILHQD